MDQATLNFRCKELRVSLVRLEGNLVLFLLSLRWNTYYHSLHIIIILVQLEQKEIAESPIFTDTKRKSNIYGRKIGKTKLSLKTKENEDKRLIMEWKRKYQIQECRVILKRIEGNEIFQ